MGEAPRRKPANLAETAAWRATHAEHIRACRHLPPDRAARLALQLTAAAWLRQYWPGDSDSSRTPQMQSRLALARQALAAHGISEAIEELAT